MNAQLLETLAALEVELHQPGTRGNRQRLEELLAAEFFEIGWSGRIHARADVLCELPGEAEQSVRASDFSMRLLADDVALLTYRSCVASSAGIPERDALRASIWKRSQNGWRMVFHQGTPVDRWAVGTVT